MPYLILFLLLAGSAWVFTETPTVGPGINAYYRDADYNRWKGIFDNKGNKGVRPLFLGP
jgi:hypothetical protein